MPYTSGLYEIVHTESGKRYIGSTIHFGKRWQGHRRSLELGDHRNSRLQRAWNKHGREAFQFRVLMICEPDDLLFFEQRCLDGLTAEYNVCKVAGSPLGIKHPAGSRTGKWERTPEYREKVSRLLTGRKFTPELMKVQLAVAAARKGVKRKPFSPEWCARLSDAAQRKNNSPEYLAKLSAAQRKRAPFPPEHCVKLAAAAKRRWDRVRAERGQQ